MWLFSLSMKVVLERSKRSPPGSGIGAVLAAFSSSFSVFGTNFLKTIPESSFQAYVYAVKLLDSSALCLVLRTFFLRVEAKP